MKLNDELLECAIAILNRQAENTEAEHGERKKLQHAYTVGLADMLDIILSEYYTNEKAVLFNPLDGSYSIGKRIDKKAK